MIYSIAFVAVLLLVPDCLGQAQRSELYDGFNSGGSFIVIPQTYAPDLALHHFDNRARSTCVTGIWLFYDYPNYNLGLNAGMEYVFGVNNYCVNFNSLGSKVSSVRFAGSPADYTADSLTLYAGTYFQGEEEFTLQDKAELNSIGSHASIIVTGSSAWTLYDRKNFSGISICIAPPTSSNYEPGFFYNLQNLEIPHGTINSVRKGCYGKMSQIVIETPSGPSYNAAGFARGGQDLTPEAQ